MIHHARVGVVSCFSFYLFMPIMALSATSTSSIPKPQPEVVPIKSLAYPTAFQRCIEQFLETQKPANAGDPINPTMFRALLHGPTGTGKTFGGEQAAKDYGCEFRLIKTAQMLTKYQNSAANMLADIFAQAALDSQSPDCNGIFLFFDEGNALGSRHSRDPNKDDSRAEEAMLLELDDWKRFNNKVLVIVATNKKDELSAPFLNRFSPGNDIEIANPTQDKIRSIIIDAYNTVNQPDLNLHIAATTFNNLNHLVNTKNKPHLTALQKLLVEIDREVRKFDAQHPDATLLAKIIVLVDKATNLNHKLFFDNQNTIDQKESPDEFTQKANKLNENLFVYIASYLTKYKKYLTEKRKPLPPTILEELIAGTSNMSIRSITVLLQEICIRANKENGGEITTDIIKEPLTMAQNKLVVDSKKTEAELAKQSEARMRSLQIQQLERDQSKWAEQDRTQRLGEMAKILEFGEAVKNAYGNHVVDEYSRVPILEYRPTIKTIKATIETSKKTAVKNKQVYNPDPREIALALYEESLNRLQS